MNVTCTVKDTEMNTTSLEVGMSHGWVRLKTFLPKPAVISLTPSQAIELGTAIIKAGWDQR